MVDRLIQTTGGLPAHQRWDSWRETVRMPASAAPLAGAGTFEVTRSVASVDDATLIDTVTDPLSSTWTAPSADETLRFLAERRIKAHMADPTLDADGRGGVAAVILDARLARAGDLLRSEGHRHRSVEDVARLCGFANHSSFSRGVRRHFGASPRDWRGR